MPGLSSVVFWGKQQVPDPSSIGRFPPWMFSHKFGRFRPRHHIIQEIEAGFFHMVRHLLEKIHQIVIGMNLISFGRFHQSKDDGHHLGTGD